MASMPWRQLRGTNLSLTRCRYRGSLIIALNYNEVFKMTPKKSELLRLRLNGLNESILKLLAVTKTAHQGRILPLVFTEILDLYVDLQRASNTCRLQLQQALDE